MDWCLNPGPIEEEGMALAEILEYREVLCATLRHVQGSRKLARSDRA